MLLTLVVACDDTQAPAVPPPPALASPPPQVAPLPPEPRETRVAPLDSETCTDRDTAVVDVTNAEVLARCDGNGETTRVLLTVVLRRTDLADLPHNALSLRFCGDVASAEGPPGWQVAIEREKGRSGVAADVTWRSDASTSPPVTNDSRRVSGFVVTLRGQWRRGLGYQVFFGGGAIAGGSPHDCPYPFK